MSSDGTIVVPKVVPANTDNAPAGTERLYVGTDGVLRSKDELGVEHIYSVTDASGMSFIPNGDIASTNVQDAIVEVRNDTDVKLAAKQPVGNYVTALTGDVTATGPGSVPATVTSVGGSSAANVHSAELAANAATNANTPNTIVKRDASGNFSAGSVTATSFIGSGQNLTLLQAANITSSQHIIGTPTDITSLERVIDHMWSAGVTDGAVITDNGNGTVNISAANVMLRSTKSCTIISSGTLATATATAHGFITGDVVSIDGAIQSAYNGNFPITVVDANTFTYVMLSLPGVSPATGTIIATGEHSPLYIASVPASGILTPADHTTSFVYTSYNSGSPTWQIGTNPTIPSDDSKSVAYTIAREGNTLYIVNFRAMNVDSTKKLIFKAIETDRFKHVPGGTAISEVPTRQISVSAGAFYYGLNRIDHPTLTSFTTVYRSAVAGSWVYTPAQTQISNQLWDNGTGTLATVANNDFIVFYIYIMNNSPSSLLVQYGQGDFATVAAAQAAPVPTPPDIVNGVGVLIGRVIIAKGAAVFSDLSSAFSVQFVPSAATNHENLSGLLGGAPNDHYHLTSGQVAILTSATSLKTPSVLVLRDANGYSMFEGVGLGTNTPTSRLQVNGSSARKGITVTANYTAADDSVIRVNNTTGPVTITLPPAATCVDRVYTIKKISTSVYDVTIDGNGSELVEGQLTRPLSGSLRPSVDIQSDGTGWWVI